MKRMLSILLMLMLVPCAALAEEEDEPVTPMHELTMAHGFRFGGAAVRCPTCSYGTRTT